MKPSDMKNAFYVPDRNTASAVLRITIESNDPDLRLRIHQALSIDNLPGIRATSYAPEHNTTNISQTIVLKTEDGLKN